MRTWNYRTYKGRRFYRKNHAKLSKNLFYLNYYRMLHTAYLKQQSSCIEEVKRMLIESCGVEPNARSISYITNTETCFVNDAVTEALNNDGKIASQECLNQLLIEIGFDVYLLQTIGDVRRPDKKVFLRWLPVKRSHKLKKMVKCFWKKRLPKEKLLYNLYYQLEPFKNDILATYRKLLVSNDTIADTAEKTNILQYIDIVIGVPSVPEDSVTEKTVTTEEVEETVVTKLISDFQEADAVMETSSSANKLEEPITFMPVHVRFEQKEEIKNVSDRPKRKKNLSHVPESRGFSEKNKMSRKKAVTCAVCVAAAGALLVPLVAYTVIKNKTA